jgi:hypothetical protein
MVDDVNAEAGAPPAAAGREAVADAEAGEAGATGRGPVTDAAAGEAPATAARDPEPDAIAGDIDFGPTVPAGAVFWEGAEGAAPAPEAGTSVVPHCTQNFAPGWVW